MFQENSLIAHGIQPTDSYITNILWSASIDVLSLLCTLYGTFICSTPKESNHLATLTISVILFYGYVYAIRFTSIEIVILCLIVPLIGLFFRFARSEEVEVKGTSKEVIELLERQKWNVEYKSSTEDCVICMKSFEPGEVLVVLPCDRRHCFHNDCILMWLEQVNKCPMCNAKVTMESFNVDILKELQII